MREESLWRVFIASAERTHGINLKEEYASFIKSMIKNNLLIKNERKYSITEKGIYHSNHMINTQEFYQILNNLKKLQRKNKTKVKHFELLTEVEVDELMFRGNGDYFNTCIQKLEKHGLIEFLD